MSARVWIEMLGLDVTEEKIARIRNLCETHRGKSPVHVGIQTTSGYRIVAAADRRLSVRADMDLRKKLETVVGRGKVKFLRA